MNIFVTDVNPYQSAIVLDDLRLNKMILESCQMLSTAARFWAASSLPDNTLLYRMAYVNHPCTVWARQNQSHYRWLLDHGFHLYSEFCRRRAKDHKCGAVLNELLSYDQYIPYGELESFVDCSGIKDPALTVFERYQECLRRKWAVDKRPPTWTYAQPPAWR